MSNRSHASNDKRVSFVRLQVMDLAQGHIDAINGLDNDEIFVQKQSSSSFGGSGGKFKAYNLGKGKGMSVLKSVSTPLAVYTQALTTY